MDSEKPEKASAGETPFSAYVKGLSSAEVEKRLQQYGPNEVPEKRVNRLRKFLGYFWGPIP